MGLILDGEDERDEELWDSLSPLARDRMRRERERCMRPGFMPTSIDMSGPDPYGLEHSIRAVQPRARTVAHHGLEKKRALPGLDRWSWEFASRSLFRPEGLFITGAGYTSLVEHICVGTTNVVEGSPLPSLLFGIGIPHADMLKLIEENKVNAPPGCRMLPFVTANIGHLIRVETKGPHATIGVWGVELR